MRSVNSGHGTKRLLLLLSTATLLALTAAVPGYASTLPDGNGQTWTESPWSRNESYQFGWGVGRLNVDIARSTDGGRSVRAWGYERDTRTDGYRVRFQLELKNKAGRMLDGAYPDDAGEGTWVDERLTSLSPGTNGAIFVYRFCQWYRPTDTAGACSAWERIDF